jgi:NADH-quinone oxidoreductase subunit G
VEENQDRIYRLKPRENPHVNQWWMCDEGRYGWKHVHDPARKTQPQRLGDAGYENVEWSDLPGELDAKLRSSQRIAAVLSPHLTVEEAYLLATYVRGIDPQARLVLGPVPTVGEDESFRNGFTIRAEKCPNRRGVEELLVGLTKELTTWDDFVSQLGDEGPDAIWVTGGYQPNWIDDATAEKFADVPLLIVQDLFASPLMERATYQLPAAAFAERDGSYVNHADRLQSFRWAIRPPAGVMTEGQLFWRLLQKQGLYKSRSVLDELTREILYFAAAAGVDVGEHGMDLKVNRLAAV